MRALGKQQVVTYVTILAYYAFGLPMAIYLGFYCNMELAGFWTAYIIAMGITDIINIYIVVTSPWKAEFNLEPESEEARVRAERSNSIARERLNSQSSSGSASFPNK